MARFNLALFFVVVLAAWSANVVQSVPLPRASDEAGTIIKLGNDGTNTTSKASSTATSTSTSSGASSTATTGTTNTTVKTDSLQCNIARAVIITDLDETFALVQQIDTSKDKNFADAVTRATEGLKTAGTGIKAILTALISGETPPADGRSSVGKGMGDTLEALSGLNSTDTGVTNALNKIKDAIAAGNEVVATCR
ncbi:hypothetical protein L218DRAFT_1007238 [Marasmius fiardii PR-910]|nr:hypothetical protein L218DRAFT_1007238 [Marasmius fiardii PR-910]